MNTEIKFERLKNGRWIAGRFNPNFWSRGRDVWYQGERQTRLEKITFHHWGIEKNLALKFKTEEEARAVVMALVLAES